MSASVAIVKPKQNEKIRKFEFATKQGGYLWQNDELFDQASGALLCKPDASALKMELGIFLSRYDEWREEIVANNRIAAESVKILESLCD